MHETTANYKTIKNTMHRLPTLRFCQGFFRRYTFLRLGDRERAKQAQFEYFFLVGILNVKELTFFNLVGFTLFNHDE